ncbi:MAG: helix-turn-helix transcriptional regulator [Acidimicrobiales bacterium]
MKTSRPYSPLTREAARLLGIRIAAARRERRMTLSELAERVGATPQTVRKVERGDPTVSLGVAFESAAVLGVPLFSPDDDRRRLEADLIENRLAVLPKQVRRPRRVRDDF